MNKLLIGHNPAANMLPMFFYLDKSDPRFEFVDGFPAFHNNLMADGKLHMAPISAFSYGEHWKEYTVLSGLSVSAQGSIGSILLFSKFSLAELDGKTIALTNASATSVNLLKLILERFYQIKPNYLTMSSNISEMLNNADAALLIADEALLGLSASNAIYVYDLSEEWNTHTGLPMTFALWAVSNAALELVPHLVTKIHRKLLESKRLGLAGIDQVIISCVSSLGYDKAFWDTYFSQLRYGLEPELMLGLETYFRLCVEHGLLPSQPQIHLLPHSSWINLD